MAPIGKIARNIYDAIIIGGGFSGVTAARELRKQGLSVVILEARDRLGGRTWFRANALGGVALEMGGAWIDPREQYAWAETQRYGLALVKPAAGNWPTTWLVQGQLRHSPLPIHPDELRDVERVIVALNAAAHRVTLDVPLSDQQLTDLDIPLSRFMDALGLSAAARDVSEVKLRTYGSAFEQDISMLHLVRRIAAAGSVSEFIMSASGYRLKAGTVSLLSAIANDTPAEVRLSTPVERIVQTDNSVEVLTSAGTFQGRAAIITVPPGVLKHINFTPALSAAKVALSAEGLACNGVKVWAIVRGAPRDFFAVGRGAHGLDWLESDGTAVGDGVLMAGYGSDADLLDITNLDAVQDAFRSFIPQAEVLEICGHDWRHDPYSLETWAVFRPGQITRSEKAIGAPEGRLVFAGAHTALRWTGFIDGAIESGKRAARETIALLNGQLLGTRSR